MNDRCRSLKGQSKILVECWRMESFSPILISTAASARCTPASFIFDRFNGLCSRKGKPLKRLELSAVRKITGLKPRY